MTVTIDIDQIISQQLLYVDLDDAALTDITVYRHEDTVTGQTMHYDVVHASLDASDVTAYLSIADALDAVTDLVEAKK